MIEKLNEAYEEMKRVDHLIYVSLKYTRTVDVIINILNRMVDAYAFMVDSMIMYATEQGKIVSEPESALERADLIKQLFKDDVVIVDNMDLYLLLRKLLRAKNVERENEYRRHVTMKTIIEGREEIVNIDIITNYYLYQREYLHHVRSIIEGKTSVTTQQQEISQDAPKIEEEENDEEVTPHKIILQPKKPKPTIIREPRPKKYKIQIPKGKRLFTRPPMVVPVQKPPVQKLKPIQKKKTVKKKAVKKKRR